MAKLLSVRGTIDISGTGASAKKARLSDPAESSELSNDGWHTDRVRRSTVPPVDLSVKQAERPTQMPPATYEPIAHDTAPPPAWLDAQNMDEETLWVRDMKERYALGDFSGAMALSELILGRSPQHQEALAHRAAARDNLISIYVSKLANLDRVFSIAVPKEELHWRGVDSQADPLLRHMDGQRSLREVIEQSGIETVLALRLLVDLAQSGVIASD